MSGQFLRLVLIPLWSAVSTLAAPDKPELCYRKSDPTALDNIKDFGRKLANRGVPLGQRTVESNVEYKCSKNDAGELKLDPMGCITDVPGVYFYGNEDIYKLRGSVVQCLRRGDDDYKVETLCPKTKAISLGLGTIVTAETAKYQNKRTVQNFCVYDSAGTNPYLIQAVRLSRVYWCGLPQQSNGKLKAATEKLLDPKKEHQHMTDGQEIAVSMNSDSRREYVFTCKAYDQKYQQSQRVLRMHTRVTEETAKRWGWRDRR